MSEYEVTRRNRVRQIREYARYDTETVHGVLDADLVSYVGFVQDGQPERGRMRAVRLFEQGETQSAVARRLDASRTTAMRWAQTWEQEGPEGLRGAGRKPRLSEEQLQQVEGMRLGDPRGSGSPTECWIKTTWSVKKAPPSR